MFKVVCVGKALLLIYFINVLVKDTTANVKKSIDCRGARIKLTCCFILWKHFAVDDQFLILSSHIVSRDEISHAIDEVGFLSLLNLAGMDGVRFLHRSSNDALFWICSWCSADSTAGFGQLPKSVCTASGLSFFPHACPDSKWVGSGCLASCWVQQSSMLFELFTSSTVLL